MLRIDKVKFGCSIPHASLMLNFPINNSDVQVNVHVLDFKRG